MRGEEARRLAGQGADGGDGPGRPAGLDDAIRPGGSCPAGIPGEKGTPGGRGVFRPEEAQ